MLIEYNVPSIQDIAVFIDDNWVMCQSCDETWQESGDNEMTWCAKCRKVMKLRKREKKPGADPDTPRRVQGEFGGHDT
jgi:hypothetical protein